MTRTLSLSLALLTVGLAAGALALPWWEWEFSGSGSGFSTSGSEQAGAFRDGDIISEGQANTAGVLTVVAAGAAFVGALLLAIGRSGVTPTLGAVLVLVGAMVMIAASLIAVTQWPGDDGAFWDESSATYGSTSAGGTRAAALGWFAAAGAGFMGLVAGAAGLARR